MKLATYFGRRVSELVRPGEPVVDLQPHLRAVAERVKPDDQRELIGAVGELQRLAADYRQLEQLMNAPLRYNYPPEVNLETRIDVAELAEAVATQERRRLGLGEQPVGDFADSSNGTLASASSTGHCHRPSPGCTPRPPTLAAA